MGRLSDTNNDSINNSSSDKENSHKSNKKTITVKMSHNQNDKIEIQIENKLKYLNVNENIPIEINDDDDGSDTEIGEENPFLIKKDKDIQIKKELPKANYELLEEYPSKHKNFELSKTYIRHIDVTKYDLDREIEYDLDDQDIRWLETAKEDEDLKIDLDKDKLELLIDRFEKESYFKCLNGEVDQKSDEKQSQASSAEGGAAGGVVEDDDEDDILCSICLDGECVNSNCILFCDMCNLAVHQECYGVPYIPEGQWLCRRCIQSPSKQVECCLCPCNSENSNLALKQLELDSTKWAHIICAIWIPEVHFANTVFLEPVCGVENIDKARWKLTCYLCKKKNKGACIQCDKQNCYTAFHVTCGQLAGLYMNIQETDPDSSAVKKVAYCDVHYPVDKKLRKKAKRVYVKQKQVATTKVPLLPELPTESIDDIVEEAGLIDTLNSTQIKAIVNYWLLKRQARNGQPLIRRLQQAPGLKKPEVFDEKVNLIKDQLFYWQLLRQNLERARMLVNLVKTREKLKRDYIKTQREIVKRQLLSLNLFLHSILDRLKQFDSKKKVFAEPVSQDVPDYYNTITQPIDLRTMGEKIDRNEYSDLDAFEADFKLMIANCFKFNSQGDYFYKAGQELRDRVSRLLKIPLSYLFKLLFIL